MCIATYKLMGPLVLCTSCTIGLGAGVDWPGCGWLRPHARRGSPSPRLMLADPSLPSVSLLVYFLDRRILYLWQYVGLTDSFVVTFSLNIGALALVLFAVSFLGKHGTPACSRVAAALPQDALT